MLFQTDFVKISFIQIEPSTEIPIYFDYMVWSVANAEDLANGAMPRYTISIPCFIQSDPSGWRRASDVNFLQWPWVRGTDHLDRKLSEILALRSLAADLEFR